MPELPEIETIRMAIAPYLVGKHVNDVLIRRDNSRYAFDKKSLLSLKGYIVQEVSRRGKLLIISLSNQKQKAALFIHLGMSGQIRLMQSSESLTSYAKHDHLILSFEDNIQLRYNDARRFGWVDVAFNQDVNAYPFFHRLGVEPLSDHFTVAYLKTLFAQSHRHIKGVLLDQKYIAGLGNIYVCEILSHAGIHPQSQASAITLYKINQLHKAVANVLNQAIISGGSSIKDHRMIDGQLGYFQHQFVVYGKEGEKCHLCPKGHIERIVQNNRSSFYCTNHQKIYENR